MLDLIDPPERRSSDFGQDESSIATTEAGSNSALGRPFAAIALSGLPTCVLIELKNQVTTRSCSSKQLTQIVGKPRNTPLLSPYPISFSNL